MPASILLAAALATAAPAVTAELPADQRAFECGNCAAWNAPHAPFKLFGNSYYVGVDGLSSVLIDTGAGLILLDGGLPQSAAVIAANIRSLGFDVADVAWIAISHPHFDHVGGVAALARMSGAKVAASPAGAQALQAGNSPDDDPQVEPGNEMNFPRVDNVEEIRHQGEIKLGTITLTAHHTPGHAPGGSSWSWRDCEGARCIDLVFADSLTAISSDNFKFTADGGARVAQFRNTINTVRALPCDLLVTAHPSASAVFDRNATGKLIDTHACHTYADSAEQALDRRIASEQKTDSD